MDQPCIFCRIATGASPARILHQDDLFVVIEDIAPQAPHHYLIIPRNHIRTAVDLSAADGDLMGHAFRIAARIASQKGFADSGFRIVVNCNPDGGQTVWHLHIHLLAGRRLSWPPG